MTAPVSRTRRYIAITIAVYTTLYFFVLLYFLSQRESGGNHHPWFGTWLDRYFSQAFFASLAGTTPLYLVSVIGVLRPWKLIIAIALFCFYFFFAFPMLAD